MKKQTKSSLTRKLDKECSRIVRARGGCQWGVSKNCSNDYDKQQCAHIFSRTYRNTRWNLNNLLSLCVGCHFEAHKNPILFTEFVQRHLGEYNYQELKMQHNAIKRYTLQEMQELLKTLEDL